MDMSNLLGSVGGAPLKAEMDLPKGVSNPKIEAKGENQFEQHLAGAGKDADNSKDSKLVVQGKRDLPTKNKDVQEDDASPAQGQNAENEADSSVASEQEAAVDDKAIAKNVSEKPKASNINGLEKISPKEIQKISDDLEKIISQFLKDSGMNLQELHDKIAQTGKLPQELQDKLSELENKIGLDLGEESSPLNLVAFVQNFVSKIAEAKPEESSEDLKMPDLNKALQKFAELQKAKLQEDQKNPLPLSPKDNVAPKPRPIDPKMDQMIRQMSNVHQKMMDSKSIAKSDQVLSSKLQNLSQESVEDKKIISSEELAVQKPGRLKDLVDSLFVQKNLQQQLPDTQLNFLNGKELASSESGQLGYAQSVRANLVEDMQTQFQKMLLTKDGGQISLKLRPGNLGELKIDLHVADKSVRLVMETEKSAAQGILKSQIGELKHQLHQAGLKVDEIQINTLRSNDANNQQNQGQQRDQQWNQQGQQQKQQKQQEARSEFVAGFEEQLSADRSAA